MQKVLYMHVIPETGASGTSRPTQRSVRRQEPQRSLPLNRLAAGTPIALRVQEIVSCGLHPRVTIEFPPFCAGHVLEVRPSWLADAKVLACSEPWPQTSMEVGRRALKTQHWRGIEALPARSHGGNARGHRPQSGRGHRRYHAIVFVLAILVCCSMILALELAVDQTVFVVQGLGAGQVTKDLHLKLGWRKPLLVSGDSFECGPRGSGGCPCGGSGAQRLWQDHTAAGLCTGASSIRGFLASSLGVLCWLSSMQRGLKP